MTTFAYALKDKVRIPQNWTGEQAKLILEFLEEITTAIWDVHDQKLIKAIQKEKSLPIRAARGIDHLNEDDLPF